MIVGMVVRINGGTENLKLGGDRRDRGPPPTKNRSVARTTSCVRPLASWLPHGSLCYPPPPSHPIYRPPSPSSPRLPLDVPRLPCPSASFLSSLVVRASSFPSNPPLSTRDPTQFWDTRRSDFWQMLIHHVATLFLLTFSWLLRYLLPQPIHV